MSCYIVDNKTISAIVKGFIDYGVVYTDGKTETPWFIFIDEERERIGQSLLEQNYESFNCRYREEGETPKFIYEDVDIDEGIVWGCIECYEYQACETRHYYEQRTHKSLQNLKAVITRRLFSRLEMKIPWGYEGHDTLED